MGSGGLSVLADGDVKTWRSPVLLIQGDDDRNVAFSNMVQLVEALRKQAWSFSRSFPRRSTRFSNA